jgi:hypothetical protein
MLSAALQKLLDLLRKLCPDEGYKVIDWAELNGDKNINLQRINELAALELIKVKYSDDAVVCLGITSTGRVLEKKVNITAKAGHGFRFGLFIGLAVFVAAFLGGFLGAFLAGML